jgi:hypothetical protein
MMTGSLVNDNLGSVWSGAFPGIGSTRARTPRSSPARGTDALEISFAFLFFPTLFFETRYIIFDLAYFYLGKVL